MTATAPIEQALVAWRRVRDENDRQPQVDDAIALGETGVFSNRNISHITGLSPEFVAELTRKKDKSGGRLNPEALPYIYDLYLAKLRSGVVDWSKVLVTLDQGVSVRVLAKLTGIPYSSIYNWVPKKEAS